METSWKLGFRQPPGFEAPAPTPSVQSWAVGAEAPEISLQIAGGVFTGAIVGLGQGTQNLGAFGDGAFVVAVESVEGDVDALRCDGLVPGIGRIAALVETGWHDHAVTQT